MGGPEDAPGWPEWWRGVVRVEELAAGDSGRVGSRYLIEWRSRVPYPLAFEFTVDRVDEPWLMEGRAEGDLSGRGRWRLLEESGVTAVLYEWGGGDHEALDEPCSARRASALRAQP